MSKIAKHLILFLASLLLAFIISGTHATVIVYFGYFCFGYALPAFLLKARHENAALLVWAVLIVLFAVVFEADRMLDRDYRPSADGWAVLFSVPILAMVLRFIFLLIDRLSRPEAAEIQVDARRAYNPRDAHPMPVAAASSANLRPGKAYRPLMGLWFLWPLGILLAAFLDGNRWDRMRYDNTLLLGMFVPPLVATAAFLAFRIYRERKSARLEAMKAGESKHILQEGADIQPHGNSAS